MGDDKIGAGVRGLKEVLDEYVETHTSPELERKASEFAARVMTGEVLPAERPLNVSRFSAELLGDMRTGMSLVWEQLQGVRLHRRMADTMVDDSPIGDTILHKTGKDPFGDPDLSYHENLTVHLADVGQRLQEMTNAYAVVHLAEAIETGIIPSIVAWLHVCARIRAKEAAPYMMKLLEELCDRLSVGESVDAKGAQAAVSASRDLFQPGSPDGERAASLLRQIGKYLEPYGTVHDREVMGRALVNAVFLSLEHGFYWFVQEMEREAPRTDLGALLLVWRPRIAVQKWFPYPHFSVFAETCDVVLRRSTLQTDVFLRADLLEMLALGLDPTAPLPKDPWLDVGDTRVRKLVEMICRHYGPDEETLVRAGASQAAQTLLTRMPNAATLFDTFENGPALREAAMERIAPPKPLSEPTAP